MFFLLVVNYNPSVFHGYEDTEPDIFLGNNLDLLASRDHWAWHMWFPIGGPLQPCV